MFNHQNCDTLETPQNKQKWNYNPSRKSHLNASPLAPCRQHVALSPWMAEQILAGEKILRSSCCGARSRAENDDDDDDDDDSTRPLSALAGRSGCVHTPLLSKLPLLPRFPSPITGSRTGEHNISSLRCVRYAVSKLSAWFVEWLMDPWVCCASANNSWWINYCAF